MSPPILSREEVRALDRRAIEEFGIPGVVLMENAGRGVAELLLQLGINGQVVICCGKGNNGGDGFVIARHLDIRHVHVQVVLFSRPEDLTGDALINYRIIDAAGLPIELVPRADEGGGSWRQLLSSADWIVDALFGTGLAGPVRPPYADAINAINTSTSRVLAVDIPSGLDCDTGKPLGRTVRAQHTATFVAMKTGFGNPAAKPWLGKVHVIDIGVPRLLVEGLRGV